MKTSSQHDSLTIQELSKEVGVGVKTISHLRHVLQMIPPPVKLSQGNGVRGFYPQYVSSYLKRVMQEKKQGLTYLDIKEKHPKEMEKAFVETELLRRQFKADRQARLELSASIRSGRPDYVMYSSVDNTYYMADIKYEMQEIKEDLKKDFQAWDGKSLDRLTHIRQKMDYLEALAAKQRITKTLLQRV